MYIYPTQPIRGYVGAVEQPRKDTFLHVDDEYWWWTGGLIAVDALIAASVVSKNYMGTIGTGRAAAFADAVLYTGTASLIYGAVANLFFGPEWGGRVLVGFAALSALGSANVATHRGR